MAAGSRSTAQSASCSATARPSSAAFRSRTSRTRTTWPPIWRSSNGWWPATSTATGWKNATGARTATSSGRCWRYRWCATRPRARRCISSRRSRTSTNTSSRSSGSRRCRGAPNWRSRPAGSASGNGTSPPARCRGTAACTRCTAPRPPTAHRTSTAGSRWCIPTTWYAPGTRCARRSRARSPSIPSTGSGGPTARCGISARWRWCRAPTTAPRCRWSAPTGTSPSTIG